MLQLQYNQTRMDADRNDCIRTERPIMHIRLTKFVHISDAFRSVVSKWNQNHLERNYSEHSGYFLSSESGSVLLQINIFPIHLIAALE